MKISRVSVAILFASMLLMIAAFPTPVAATGTREEDLVMNFYANVEAAYESVKAGDNDAILYELTSELYFDAVADNNLVVAPVADSGFYEFDLNCNETIIDFAGIVSPMSYDELRQAIGYMTDKFFIQNEICGGFVERIDQMVAAPYKGWANESMWYPYYPWEYDLQAAADLLDTKFPQGATVNTHYTGEAWSAQYIRTYPVGHSLAGNDLDPLVTCIRSDDNQRYQAGLLVADLMERMGLPLNQIVGIKAALYDRVMGDFNYHFYTGGWSVGRFPPLSLYGLYHSDYTYAYGPNYVTGNGTFPYLDDLLEDCNYAITYNDAVTACKLATGYMTERAIEIPLWSARSYWVWRKELLGTVNFEGQGYENGYTFMNCYKVSGDPINVALISYPNTLNIVYSNWVYDYNVLDRLNMYGGVDVPPYNLAADQAGLITEWDTTTWNDGANDYTLFTQTYRSDAYFCKPETGALGENINATNYFWNSWYEFQVGDGWSSSSFVDLHHITIDGEYDSSCYFNTLSYFNTYYCQGPLKPMDVWGAQPELVTKVTEAIVDPTTPGVVPLTDLPTWFEYVEFDGTPLTLGTDYNIVEGDLYIYATLGAGTLDVKYWAPNDPAGSTPGEIPGLAMLEGGGMYYITAYTPLAGGSATMKKNPYFYGESLPLLGDIDFVKKSSGGYKVDIFDLAIAGAAFGSQGTGIPSSNWFAGADLAPPGGYIDIYDEVTVTGANWDQEYDLPP